MFGSEKLSVNFIYLFTVLLIPVFDYIIDVVRKEFDTFQPTSFNKIGDDEVVTVKNVLLYSKDDTIEKFFGLQKEHRESEKVVNYYKAKHKDWEKVILDDHSKVVAEINSKNKDIKVRNNQVATKAMSEFESDKRKRKKDRIRQ